MSDGNLRLRSRHLQTAKSAKLIHWALRHSELRLFDVLWQVQQQVGTQQGACHSPALFGRILASKFDALCAQWERDGELPAFKAGMLSLWGIWFIDDAICLFRSSAQYRRLLPQLVQMLQDLGLQINVKKSSTLSNTGSPGSTLGLRSVPHVSDSGLDAGAQGGRFAYATGDYRGLFAELQNLLLLVSPAADRASKLRLFHALVTGSILWSLCVLAPHQSSLRSQVTLLGWVLRVTVHFSWDTSQYIFISRDAVKLWAFAYAGLWDELLLTQQWRWVGHLLRQSDDFFCKLALTDLQATSRTVTGMRRCRTGPNNSGHRMLFRWMHSQGIPHEAAHDRSLWDRHAIQWVRHHGIAPGKSDFRIWPLAAAQYTPATYKGVQGVFTGRQVFLLAWPDSGLWVVAELDRSEGWRCHTLPFQLDFSAFQSCLHYCLEHWCKPRSFYCRLYLLPMGELAASGFVFGALPAFDTVLDMRRMVCEVSEAPPAWVAR